MENINATSSADSFTFTVLDNSSVSIDLYGRIFALDTGELPVNDGFDVF